MRWCRPGNAPSLALLDWHVREQVEFNRRVLTALDAAIEAFNESNRALVEMGNRMGDLGDRLAELDDRLAPRVSAVEGLAGDMRNHWADWRLEWERKLSANEIQFLRSVADLQGGFQHRANLMERPIARPCARSTPNSPRPWSAAATEIQQRLWADLERIRLEYERLIHSELRLVRQRAALHAPEPRPPPPRRLRVRRCPALRLRPLRRAIPRLRRVRQGGQEIYLPYFAGLPRTCSISAAAAASFWS